MPMVTETALELVFDELLKAVVAQTMPSDKNKTLLKRLENTLECIQPIFFERRRLRKVLDRPEEETTMFIFHLKKGKELVVKCSRMKFWNVYQNFVYSNKLNRLNNELLWFFGTELQEKMMSDSMRSLIGIYDLSDKMDQVLSAVTTHVRAITNSCRVPRLPEHIVGFNWHLEELKRRLLSYDTQMLVVSGPGGCGKTTLVKMLCHDNEMKDIFGENILYVTVSRQSSLKIIIQKIFEHHGENHYEFQTDEEARNQLENQIKRKGSNKMLLVLDDVWSESESIIQDLKFQMPGYKVLVTSRFLFPRFNSTYELGLLNDKDAKTLFCYYAFPSDGIPINVTDDLVNKIVKFCKGLPLTLTVVGASLCGQPVLKWKTTLKKWSESGSILQSNISMLLSLKSSVDALDELPIVKECFLDLGSFPEDERISTMVLMDMWVELYNLDDEGMYTTETLFELSLRNLINLVPLRKDGELDDYSNELYVTQHDLLREIVIHLSSQEPIIERKRLFIEIHTNEFPTWWIAQIEHPINARILSISTDEASGSIWYDLKAPKVEVLTINIRSNNYTLAEFIKRMGQLKVLSIKSYSDYPSQLHNLSVIECLSNLKTIRFEHILVSNIQPIFALMNLRKLSFVMCEIGNALMSCFIETTYILSNIKELEFNLCYNLKELPSGLCHLVHLQKLSITSCQELDVLPKGLGSLSNLEILWLHCCTKLQELPESIGSLRNLSFIDISYCLNISVLPKEIGELCGLRVLKMDGCSGLQELPMSISKLSNLEDVICDEETSYLWTDFQNDLHNLTIKVVEDDRFESFRKIVH